jgi:hypothetical protein
MVTVRPPAFTSFRFYFKPAEKPDLKLIAKLRKLTEVLITNACGDVLAATRPPRLSGPCGLRNERRRRVALRTAGEGLVDASVLSHRVGSSPGGVLASKVLNLDPEVGQGTVNL